MLKDGSGLAGMHMTAVILETPVRPSISNDKDDGDISWAPSR